MTKRKALILSAHDREELMRIRNSRTESASSVQRAKILLFYSDGTRITDIVRKMDITRPLAERCIDKALTFGPLQALRDLPRCGHPTIIGDDAKSWVLSIACQKPTDLGYAAQTWTYRMLINHIREHCQKHGYPSLSKIGKGQLHFILSKSNIKPHKISCYLDRKDPDFDAKMTEVLCVYKEVEILNSSKEERRSVTVSYDEKPGIQAIKNIAAELMPAPGRYAARSRDYEYNRLGTVSLLAGIDLHTGKVHPLLRDRHRSREFIEFLTLLDQSYPLNWKIRLVLDNHSSHISQETQAYLRDHSERFVFVFTPKHGSWLNLVEVFFSKMARSLLRHIRVDSKAELIDRIYRGIDEFNKEPVIFRWRYKMDEMASVQ
jgi:transposase